MCGVLPVPPTVTLPTQITGTEYFFCFKIPLSNKKLRSPTPSPYNHENGIKIGLILGSGLSIE